MYGINVAYGKILSHHFLTENNTYKHRDVINLYHYREFDTIEDALEDLKMNSPNIYETNSFEIIHLGVGK